MGSAGEENGEFKFTGLILCFLNYTRAHATCLENIQPWAIKKLETILEENTRNTVHRTMMPQSPSK